MKTLPKLVLLTASTALTVAGLAGCGSSSRYQCVDTKTQVRVTDSRCPDNSGRYSWWQLKPGARYPAIGGKVPLDSGVKAAPSKRPKALPSTGGTVKKPGTGGSKSRSSRSGHSSHSGGGHH